MEGRVTGTQLASVVTDTTQLQSKIDRAIATQDVSALVDILATVGDVAQRLKEERASLTRPYYQAKKKIEDSYRSIVHAYEDLEHRIISWIEDYSARLMAEGKMFSVRTEEFYAQSKIRWVIEDIGLVPKEFIMVDEDKLEEFIREYADNVEIPGIRFERYVTLRKRPRRPKEDNND